jgi:hypothetical protein
VIFPSLAVIYSLPIRDVSVNQRDFHTIIHFFDQDLKLRIGTLLRKFSRPPGLQNTLEWFSL